MTMGQSKPVRLAENWISQRKGVNLLEAISYADAMAESIIASVAVPQEKNTQQPVAWRYIRRADGEVVHDTIEMVKWTDEQVSYVAKCYDVEVIQLYPAPPLPRDVLMAALGDLRSQCAHALDGYYIPSDASNVRHDIAVIDLAAIADRHASQVQPDVELVSYAPDMATCTLRIGDEQYLFDRHVDQPEPVNQLLLAALNHSADALERAEFFEQETAVRAAIAEAVIAACQKGGSA